MKKLISSIVLLLTITFIHAQANNPQAQQSLLQLGLMSNTALDPVALEAGDREFDVKGSPFLSDEFAEGDIFLKRGDSVLNKQVRYNIMEDVLEIAMDSYFMKLDANPIYSFHIGNNSLVMDFVNSKYIPSANNIGYLQRVFVGNNLSIYMNLDVDRKVKDSLEPYGASKNLVEYVTTKTVYFLYKDTFFEVASRKDLEDNFDEKLLPKKVKRKDLENEAYLVDLGNQLDN